MDDVERAAEAIAKARALLITAGAGMGVDSGLPDFRGDEGFWKAYPPFRERLVRINVRESETPPGHVGLAMGALAALTRVEALRSGS